MLIRSFNFGTVSLLLILAPSCAAPHAPSETAAPAPATELIRIRLLNQSAAGLTQLLHDATGVYAGANDWANTLVIKGPPDKVDQARQLTEELERSDAGGLNTDLLFVYRLKSGKAQEIASILQALGDKGVFFATAAFDGSTTIPFIVLADARTNSLVIHADIHYEARLRQIIEQLDVPIPAATMPALNDSRK